MEDEAHLNFDDRHVGMATRSLVCGLLLLLSGLLEAQILVVGDEAPPMFEAAIWLQNFVFQVN